MSHTVVRAPRSVGTFSADRGRGIVSAITIALSEPARSQVAYRVRVDAKFSGGLARVGSLITAPPDAARPASRVIAVASMPGVLKWLVTVTPVRPYDASAVGGTLKLAGCEYPGCCGIFPLAGSLIDSGGPGAGAYRHDAGSGPGNVVIPAGAEVGEYSANATPAALGGTGATIDISSQVFGGLPQIPVPPDISFSASPKNLVGPATFAIGGDVDAWFVSWSELRA